MTDDDCKAKILEFITALITDMDKAETMMADGFVWENFLPENVPFGGTYEGIEGMKAYFGELAANWEIGGLDIPEVIVSADGRRFAAIGVEQNGKALSTGKSCNMPFVWIFKTDEAGKFSYVREYNDTHVIGQTFV